MKLSSRKIKRKDVVTIKFLKCYLAIEYVEILILIAMINLITVINLIN